MKLTLRILVGLTLILWIVGGFYHFNKQPNISQKLIGSGVLILALILIPLFIYNRYKGKDLTRYSLYKENENDTKNLF